MFDTILRKCCAVGTAYKQSVDTTTIPLITEPIPKATSFNKVNTKKDMQDCGCCL